MFAYGQTNSGKTHTMRGSATEPGVIPLSVHELFETIQQVLKARSILKYTNEKKTAIRCSETYLTRFVFAYTITLEMGCFRGCGNFDYFKCDKFPFNNFLGLMYWYN